jgi:hypothetical protein
MSKYETHLESLGILEENAEGSFSEALEAASDSLGFVTSLHSVFKDNGYDLGEEPDVSALEHILDSMFSELAAASLFLSEDSFQQVPTMLRTIAKAFEQTAGGDEVPTVIIEGYNRLADRIEATRVQQQQMKELLAAQPTK